MRLARLCLVLAAGFVVGGLALAQRPGFGGGFFNNPAFLLANEGVQKELKLSDEQIEKVKTIGQESREKYKDDFAKLKDTPKEQIAEKFQELSKKISDDVMKQLQGVLKPEQTKRLKQITLQQQGSQAFADPEIEKALSLSAEQKEKIKTIRDDAGKEMAELRQNAKGNFKEIGPKMATLRKETLEKVNSVLTAEQKTKWKDLTGEPFEVRFELRPKQ